VTQFMYVIVTGISILWYLRIRGLFQTVVKSGYWFAASVDGHDSYSLVGCTVSPGFDYCDWELGDMELLARMYPQHKSIIEKYSR
jgi:uncharacterized protein